MPEPCAPRSVADASPIAFPWGEIRWLCNRDLDSGAEMTFGVVSIQAGDRNDLHAHPNCEEVIYVVSGRCRHRLGDAEFDLEPGAALRIPRGEWHRATASAAEPCVMVIAYSSPDRQTIFRSEDTAENE